jgi:polysaccharide biosynthesis protein PslH
MKKILFLTHQPPYPPVSGGAIKRWKLVEYLSQHYHLGLALFYQDPGFAWRDELLSRLSLSHFHAERLAKKRNPANFIKSLLRGMSLSLYRTSSSAFKKHIASIAGDYDILFFDSYLMFQYVPAQYGGRVVLHAHNAEHVIWQQYARFENNFLKRALVLREAKKIMDYERFICGRAHAVLAAPGDREHLEKLGVDGGKFYETLHLGDERLLGLRDIQFDETQEAFLSVGTLGWAPNDDGLVWFISHAWDRLKLQHPALRFYIVGADPGAHLQKLCAQKKDIVLTGFVDDLEEYYAKCRVFVAPLRFGSGIKVKVVNALYRGIPVVTTPTGAESLEVVHMHHAAVPGTIENMVQDCGTLLRDREVWQLLRDNSRQLARQRYRWQGVFENLEKALQGSLQLDPAE